MSRLSISAAGACLLLAGVAQAADFDARWAYDQLTAHQRRVSDMLVTRDYEGYASLSGTMRNVRKYMDAGKPGAACGEAADLLADMVDAMGGMRLPAARRSWLEKQPFFAAKAADCAREAGEANVLYVPRDLYGDRAKALLCDQDPQHLNPDCPR